MPTMLSTLRKRFQISRKSTSVQPAQLSLTNLEAASEPVAAPDLEAWADESVTHANYNALQVGLRDRLLREAHHVDVRLSPVINVVIRVVAGNVLNVHYAGRTIERIWSATGVVKEFDFNWSFSQEYVVFRPGIPAAMPAFPTGHNPANPNMRLQPAYPNGYESANPHLRQPLLLEYDRAQTAQEARHAREARHAERYEQAILKWEQSHTIKVKVGATAGAKKTFVVNKSLLQRQVPKFFEIWPRKYHFLSSTIYFVEDHEPVAFELLLAYLTEGTMDAIEHVVYSHDVLMDLWNIGHKLDLPPVLQAIAGNIVARYLH